MRNPTARKVELIAISLLALIFLCSNLGVIVSAHSANQVQSAISVNFHQGSDPSDSYLNVTVSATVNNGVAFANNPLSVQGWAALNGTVVGYGSCTLHYSVGQDTSSCVYQIPYAGNGHYWLNATISDSHGKALSLAWTDPPIEPEWRSN